MKRKLVIALMSSVVIVVLLALWIVPTPVPEVSLRREAQDSHRFCFVLTNHTMDTLHASFLTLMTKTNDLSGRAVMLTVEVIDASQNGKLGPHGSLTYSNAPELGYSDAFVVYGNLTSFRARIRRLLNQIGPGWHWFSSVNEVRWTRPAESGR